MKKILLFLFALITSHCWAQLQETAIFDFNSPTSLTPSISPATTDGSYVIITNKTFTDKKISLSFTLKNSYGIAELYTKLLSGMPNQYYMGFSKNTLLHVKAQEGCFIKSIEFEGPSWSLNSDVGTFSFDEYKWTASSDIGHQEVIFSTRSNEPSIYKITVHYIASSEILKPSKVEIIDKDNNVVNSYSSTASEIIKTKSFKSLNITFPSTIEALNLSAIKMTDKDNHPVAIVPTCSGKVLSIVVTTVITEDGDYSITVPARSVQSNVEDQTIQNMLLPVYRFIVHKTRDTFNYTKVFPDQGNVTSLPQVIKLAFPKDTKLITDPAKSVKMYKNGEAMYSVTMKRDEMHKDTVLLDNNHGVIDNAAANLGVWTIVIPDSLIHTPFQIDGVINSDDYWNPSDTLTWTVIETPDPLKDKKDEVARLKVEAINLYALINTLGYPKTDNASTPLADVKDADIATTEEGLNAQIANLKAAIKAFYDATDVVLPSAATSERDGWYTITSVARGGSELPLHYENGAVKVGGKATSFQVVSITDAGVVVLKTADGHYLHVLTTVKTSTLTSDKNVTSNKSYVNNLTLAKLKLAGEETDQKPVAGLFTIKGALGRDLEDNDLGAATALVTHPEGAIITDPAVTTLYFDTDKSSGFRFAVGSYPGAIPQSVTPKAELLVNKVDYNTQSLTLKVIGSVNESDITTVSLNNNPKPYFVVRNADDTQGDSIKSPTGATIIEPLNDGMHENYFKVNVNNLNNGKYYLKMPKGTFSYTGNDIPVVDDSMRVAFTIGPNFTHDLQKYIVYSNYPAISGNIPIRDTHLNEFRVFAYKNYDNPSVRNFYADPGVKVLLYDYFHVQDGILREGHLVEDEYFYDKDVWAYKVVWDRKIEAGDFPELNAGIMVQENTIGDINFGKWLQDRNSVSEESCHVNYSFVCYYKVDNANVSFDPNGDGVIDVADIALVIDVLAGVMDNIFADVNGDGVVDVADIATLITLMAIQNSL